MTPSPLTGRMMPDGPADVDVAAAAVADAGAGCWPTGGMGEALALPKPPPPAWPLATHWLCFHAALLARRDDLST